LQMHLGVVFGHAERTGVHAVAAIEAAWLERAHHHAFFGNLDRIRRTDERTRGLVAMHADRRHGCGRFGAIEIVDEDHRVTLMRCALAARSHTRAAAYATLRIDE